jgi:NADH:ubiquinone oxidoreductase subunit F (NADH-binding)/NADH:ubiquinone oxidoreductase subunit E
MNNIKSIYPPLNPIVQSLIDERECRSESILDIFMIIQQRQGGLTKEVISDVARILHIPFEQAYGVASFYSMLSLMPDQRKTIRLCDGPVCLLNGADNIRKNFIEKITQFDQYQIERTSCLGLCDRAPAALVNSLQVGPLNSDILQKGIINWNGLPVDYSQPRTGETRVILPGSSVIDPDSIISALNNGVYQSLKIALNKPPNSIINEIEDAGLTGRGGAGFPVGRKMRFVAQAQAQQKFVICNADESEPLIFKDRVLIDTNPHQLLEGVIIAGYATGCNEAYIYIRGEYTSQAIRLENAIQQARDHNILGENILGSNFAFNIHIHKGAGAYICGEETALIESLEGKRGEPRIRPPYPPSYGYKGYPTLVNNVESLSAIPPIIRNGADWYHSLGNSLLPGTKLYMVLGFINHPGLFEAPFGLTLRQIIEDYGGGMKIGSIFNFALTGGAAGTIVPPSLLDIPIDYTSVTKGISLGAGAFLICDHSISPVTLLRELLHFFEVESCGKCTPCRQGTHQSSVILNRMISGNAKKTDIDELSSLADILQNTSFCGLGQSAAIPIKSALTNFRSDFLQTTHLDK